MLKIAFDPPQFQDTIDPQAADLITSLLHKDPADRLRDVDTIKVILTLQIRVTDAYLGLQAHPFFHDIDWTALSEQTFPVPDLTEIQHMLTHCQGFTESIDIDINQLNKLASSLDEPTV